MRKKMNLICTLVLVVVTNNFAFGNANNGDNGAKMNDVELIGNGEVNGERSGKQMQYNTDEYYSSLDNFNDYGNYDYGE